MNKIVLIVIAGLLMAGCIPSFLVSTPEPTYTPYPTLEPLPTYTPYPTLEPLPTYTPYPTPEPLPTYTPYPTIELMGGWEEYQQKVQKIYNQVPVVLMGDTPERAPYLFEEIGAVGFSSDCNKCANASAQIAVIDEVFDWWWWVESDADAEMWWDYLIDLTLDYELLLYGQYLEWPTG